MTMKHSNYDVVIVGGGFYGCCLAVHLKDRHNKILLVEKETSLLSRSSAVNQARVHSGFHYPRSFVTALRSLANLPRFMLEFRNAIVDDFTMLYAVSRHASKVNANRFYSMFKGMKASITHASPHHRALFSSDMIEDVFQVKEYAFDFTIIRNILQKKLNAKGVEVSLSTQATQLRKYSDGTIITLDNGNIVTANQVFCCTYSLLNNLLDASSEKLLPLKHEITEVTLVQPPDDLKNLGITVMDGPFFSTMPFPARDCYSLTHVRYTPHKMWQDTSPCINGHHYLAQMNLTTNYLHMIRDASKYMPCIANSRYIDSLFEVKTVLLKNEGDDGRPIMLQQHESIGKVYSILGGKIDNIYDLFECLDEVKKEYRDAS